MRSRAAQPFVCRFGEDTRNFRQFACAVARRSRDSRWFYGGERKLAFKVDFVAWPGWRSEGNEIRVDGVRPRLALRNDGGRLEKVAVQVALVEGET